MIRRTVMPAVLMFIFMYQICEAGVIHGPVEWTTADGGNGHYYALYEADVSTWTEARDAAASTSFMGSQGYLVTVTDGAEDAFLFSHFGNYIGDPNASGGLYPDVPGIRAWIGLTDEVTEGDFQWVTGEPFSYSNWAPPEPNNLGNEDYVAVWRRDYGDGPLWSWNDSGNIPQPPNGYLVEYSGPFAQPVPEPSTFSLFGFAILSLVIYRSSRGNK